MKTFCFLILVLMATACKSYNEISAHIYFTTEKIGSDEKRFITIELKNNTDKYLYINNFSETNSLIIKSENGKDIFRDPSIDLRDILNAELEKSYPNIPPIPVSGSETSTKINAENKTIDTVKTKYQELHDEAVRKDIEKARRFNENVFTDDVLVKAVTRSLNDKYCDMIFFKPYEVVYQKVDITYLQYLKRKCSISVEYPKEHIPSVFYGYMHCNKALDGRADKIFMKYPSGNAEEVGGYISFDKKIRSNLLRIE